MMSDRLKQRITNLGFGSLLKKNIEGLEDKHLGAFLLSSVYDDPLRIEFGSRSLPIAKAGLSIDEHHKIQF